MKNTWSRIKLFPVRRGGRPGRRYTPPAPPPLPHPVPAPRDLVPGAPPPPPPSEIHPPRAREEQRVSGFSVKGLRLRVWGSSLKVLVVGCRAQGPRFETPPPSELHPPRARGGQLVSGVGFIVQGLRFGVQGSGFRFWGIGLRVQDLGFGVWG